MIKLEQLNLFGEKMKQYIGTKIVNAKPMNRGDYNILREWALAEDEDPTDEGYLVEYVDGGKLNHPSYKGYISWSPKYVFEKHYSITENSISDTDRFDAIENRFSLNCHSEPNHAEGGIEKVWVAQVGVKGYHASSAREAIDMAIIASRSKTIIIFDTETTGLITSKQIKIEHRSRIVELGAVKVVDGVVIDELTQLINPEIIITDKLTKIHGISNEMVSEMPTFEEFIPKLLMFFKDADVLVAHNAKYDVSMLENELERANFITFPMPEKIICTVQEYSSEFGCWPKMAEVYEKKVGKPLNQKHRALDDCQALYEILTVDKFWEKIDG